MEKVGNAFSFLPTEPADIFMLCIIVVVIGIVSSFFE